ncbi:hypothetical protein MTR_1g052620 [Medicago truncatula]|uniref:Uncharacterized protein n=1 Tax=Medicago truncatula TaxID=3880 RepID=A0A072VIE5_MEDTR|nr:hypothetical protein MTR_1g052620 [Medicago truncatula]
MSNSLNKLGEIYANGIENMKQVFTSCFVHEKHTADRRNQIVSILKEIEGLSDAEVVMAGMLITKDNNLCDYFFHNGYSWIEEAFILVDFAIFFNSEDGDRTDSKCMFNISGGWCKIYAKNYLVYNFCCYSLAEVEIGSEWFVQVFVADIAFHLVLRLLCPILGADLCVVFDLLWLVYLVLGRVFINTLCWEKSNLLPPT